MVNYLDDFGSASLPGSAGADYNQVSDVFRALGLEEATDKAAFPATRMEFLGIMFDTVELQMEVTPSRLVDTQRLLAAWLQKRQAYRVDLESLIGKLQFVAKCVKPGRLFISRMLAALSAIKGRGLFNVGSELKKDLLWWQRFLDTYNGVSLIGDQHWSQPDSVFATDACPGGAGGFCDGEFFHSVFPKYVKDRAPHINALELWAVVLAAKLWSSKFRGLRILIHCDNMTTVIVINSGKAKDPILLALLRELAFVTATGEFEIRALHIPGETNRIPDHLSRWHLNPSHRKVFHKLTQDKPLIERHVPASLFHFSQAW